MTPRLNSTAAQPAATRPDFHTSELVEKALVEVNAFYERNPHIQESHGMSHVQAVYQHALHALSCCYDDLADNEDTSDNEPLHYYTLDSNDADDVLLAALLHDTDDAKYFPRNNNGDDGDTYPNARNLLERLFDGGGKVSNEVTRQRRVDRILDMIDWVSCSKNGNSIPDRIQQSHEYHWLIPRWSDRLEAVGPIGVVRCFQYCQENGGLLSSEGSPRARTVEQVWAYATPERFAAYQERGGSSADMISHYYDKLLHVACPPKESVRNTYLEEKGRESAKELMAVCLRYGRTGSVDEEYLNEMVESVKQKG